MPTITQQKMPHRLHECRTVDDLSKSLLEAGINLQQMEKKFIREGTPFALLLSGSIPEGTATAESDLDLMMLVEHTRDLKEDSSLLNVETGLAKETLFYTQGIEINIEFMCRDSLGSVIEALIALAPVMYDPREVERIPVIERPAVHFLHRLRTGWILSGESIVNRWRDEFMVSILPLYLSVNYYFEALEVLERAYSMVGGLPGSAAYLGHVAAESGLRALLAGAGYTGQGKKGIFPWCARLEAEDVSAAMMIRAGRELIFPGFLTEQDQQRKYLESVIQFIRLVREHLGRDEAIGRAINYLHTRVSYCAIGDF